jgi:hypothetical protein
MPASAQASAASGAPPSPAPAGAVGGMMMVSRTAAAPAAANVTPSSVPLPSIPMPGSAGARVPPATAMTDAEGRFVFANLDPGDYQISAQRDNFQYNAPRRPEPLSLKAGDAKTDIVLRVAPLGVIAGHVRNEDGDPAQNLQVSLMTYQYSASGRQLSSRGTAVTNDLGEYRLFGVAPGKYYLKASPAAMRRNSDDDETYVASYYPGALDPTGAAPVDIGAGQELRGIDFLVRRARTVSVRGRVIKPEGASSVTVSLTQTMEGGGMTRTNTSVNDAEGRFEWRGLMTGSYTLGAQASAGGAALTARLPIQAGVADIDGIELRLAPAATLAGVLRIEGNTDRSPSPMRVALQGGSPGMQMAAVKDDGSFQFPSLDPDLYKPTVPTAGNLYLKSARCGGTDVTATGIDLTGGGGCDLSITLSANSGKVDGRVEADSPEAAASAIVALVAEGPRRGELFRSATADADGRFTIAGLAPGSYKAYAWEDVDVNAVRYDPDFVRPFESSGVSVQVTEGATASVNPKLVKKPAER